MLCGLLNHWVGRSVLALGPFMPPQGSKYAAEVDRLYSFIFWLSAFFFVGIVGAMTFFVIRYRRTETPVATPRLTHHIGLELMWTIIPLILVVIIFFWGFNSYIRGVIAPGDVMEIRVTAKKWLWEFEYPNGTRSPNELHVPSGKAVKLIMSSQDVIHSFFLPTFRVKQDVLPNRYSTLWFEPLAEGEHVLFCAEYCGDGHSDMLGKVFVEPESKYKEWLETGGGNKDMPLAELGAALYKSRSCYTCHSLDGSRQSGPSFKGLYGRTERLTDGTSVPANDDYIRESIMYPQAKVVAGFEPVMPTYKGLLRDREVNALIEFIKLQK